MAGCRASGVFSCDRDEQCRLGTTGRCEPTGFCSFDDQDCPSGSRYDELAGDGFASECVGGPNVDADVDASATDARIDGPPADAAVDAPPAPGCPTGYYVISGLTGGYRYVSISDDWLAAELDCEDDGAGTHLVVVGGGSEHSGIDDLSPGEDELWIGVSDRVTEGTYRNVVNAIQSFLPWDSQEPTGANENCVYSKETNFNDDNCTDLRRYVCECDGVAAVPSSY